MARARDCDTHVASRIIPLMVITLAARGARGQPVVLLHRVRSRLMLVGLALAYRERAGDEVHSEEHEQNGEADQPTQHPPVTASIPSASHTAEL